MKEQEAAALLTVAAAFDNRKPDEVAAQAWSVALDGLRPADCKDAIISHYRDSHEWIMPDHIRHGVAKIRRERIEAVAHIQPPDGLETAEYMAWIKELHQRAGDGEHIEPPLHVVATDPPPELEAHIARLNAKIDKGERGTA